MLNSGFLEALNGVLFMLSAAAAFVFGRYVLTEAMAAGVWPRRWPSKAQAAFGLLIVFVGEAIIRGWIWWWRQLLNDGEDASWMAGYPILAIGGATSAVGILCIIRHFSPDEWQDRAWLITLLFAIATGLLIGWAAN